MSVGDASRAEDQDSLLILLGDTTNTNSGRLRRRRLGKRFVDGGHGEVALLCLLIDCVQCAQTVNFPSWGSDRAGKNAKTRKSWQQRKTGIWINIFTLSFGML